MCCILVQAESQARYYRRWAAEQRSKIREMQDKVSYYQEEKSRLETDLRNKRQELGEWLWLN